MRLFLFATIIFLTAAAARANILVVPSQTYPTIQAGIDSSGSGDTVMVSRGTYYENIDLMGRNIVLSSFYLADNDTATITHTIINGSTPIQADSASCVRVVRGEGPGTVIEGFTLTGGHGTKWRDIHNHLLYREGGGIFIELSSPTIRNNLIVRNDASDRTGCASAGGGGIRIGDGGPIIEDNVIAFNTGRYGGGIVLNYTNAVIRNNLIVGNSGGQDYGGGGIWGYAVGPNLIFNNTIVGNYSAQGGGGIMVWSTSINGENNILWDNTSAYDTAQISLNGGTAELSYSCVKFGWPGNGNIDVGPRFDASGLFYLQSSSPCIDAGDPDVNFNDPENYQNPGHPRWPSQGTLRNDIGVYGGPGSRLLPYFDPYLGIDDDRNNLPNNAILARNYPNPFNSQTVIEYSLPTAGNVAVTVYDIMGRAVMNANEGSQPAGLHRMAWDASRMSSGIYFYKVSLDGYSKISRMALVK